MEVITKYLSYDEYMECGGTLEESAFFDYAYDAASIIDWYTFNRLDKMTTIPNEVKLCMLRLINLLNAKTQAAGLGMDTDGNLTGARGSLASESNDGVTTTYAVFGAKDLVDYADKQVQQTVTRYLSRVTTDLGYNLLYRGLYPDE